MNKVHFAKEMAILGVAFQSDVEPLIEVYWTELELYSDESMSNARKAHCRTGEFFPRIANLINLMEGTAAAKAHEEWAEVLKQLRNAMTASFNLKAAKIVTVLGGSNYLAHLTYRELEFKKKDFIDMYESMDAADPTPRIEPGQSQIGMVNDLVKKVTDDSARNSDDENEPDS